jgi:transmembrane sensor
MQLQRQIDHLLALQASQWHQILDHANEAQRQEFVKWLRQSPLNVDEYLATVCLDRALERVDPDRQVDVEPLLARIVPELTPLALGPAARVAASHAGAPKLGKWKWMLAAIVAAFALGLPLLYSIWSNTKGTELSTAIGEQRTVELADASVVALNADTELQVHLNAAAREIELVRGEALFDVAPDPRRPFRVQTRNATVQAVGTQFNIYERRDGSTRISVLEGRIKVILQGSRAALSDMNAVTLLSAGEEVEVLPEGRLHHVRHANVSSSVAWRQRQLVFDEASLEDVVYEFNRYSKTTRVRIEGLTPGTRHYNGIFNGSDPDALADLLSREHDLLVERTPGQIIIRAR